MARGTEWMHGTGEESGPGCINFCASSSFGIVINETTRGFALCIHTQRDLSREKTENKYLPPVEDCWGEETSLRLIKELVDAQGKLRPHEKPEMKQSPVGGL
ncbi:hypothetical protein BTVI_36210 [Pitangus sulphuratus]|nr:hypothetical protein BTVI_36210 [Pitangus sulphuratus]